MESPVPAEIESLPVLSIWVFPDEDGSHQPALYWQVVGGPKTYASWWPRDDLYRVNWNWTLPTGAIEVWRMIDGIPWRGE